jgi:carboxylesterase
VTPDRVDSSDFHFAGGPVGCLLIHGFSGTPYEMRPLGERLRDAGHTVRGIRLPGHATSGAELYTAGRRDWYAATLAGAEDLARHCRTVMAVGLSMGALLALRLAAERADIVSRLVVLAPAIALSDTRLARRAPWMRLAVPFLPRRWASIPKQGSDIADAEAKARHPRFPVALRGLNELAALQREVRMLLPRITQPVLVLHGRLDRTTPVENAEFLRRGLGSRDVRVRLFERSAHILTVDVERDEVAAEVVRFVAEA